MAIEDSLLDRLGGHLRDRLGDRVKTTYTLTRDPARVADSVALNLSRLMNTRKGSSSAMPDYGLPDLNEMMTTEGVSKVRSSIRLCIEQYEPRLTDVTVSHLPDDTRPLNLHFSLSAQLLVGEERRRVTYDTRVTGAGLVQVKK